MSWGLIALPACSVGWIYPGQPRQLYKLMGKITQAIIKQLSWFFEDVPNGGKHHDFG